MPKRDEEFWDSVKSKSDNLIFMCPYCDSRNISRLTSKFEREERWKCNGCKKEFEKPRVFVPRTRGTPSKEFSAPGAGSSREKGFSGGSESKSTPSLKKSRQRKPLRRYEYREGVPKPVPIPKGKITLLVLVIGFIIWVCLGVPLPHGETTGTTSAGGSENSVANEPIEQEEKQKAGYLNDSFFFGLPVNSEDDYISGSHGRLVVLINNRNARNPTYQELVNFLAEDDTDTFSYTDTGLSTRTYGDPHDTVDKQYWLDVINGKEDYPHPNVCADFAERLHNKAEMAGIRAGYVTVDFADSDSGHALNVFKTTDRGRVYIDDTGGKEHLTVKPTEFESTTFGEISSYDKVAYIKRGEPLGVISLSVADSYGFDYEAYEKWIRKKELFDSKLNKYDAKLGGRTTVPQKEYEELNKMMHQLKQLDNELGGFWEPIGVVKDFKISWEGE